MISREHLYRAKRVNWMELPKEEWWVEGAVLQSETETRIATSFFSSGEAEEAVMVASYLVDQETVCEYTGLTNKNGGKIFENDIVAYMDTYSTDNGYAESDCIGKVLWCEEELCFHVTERLSAESWEVLEDCYVIGNIFDNPELLKEV